MVNGIIELNKQKKIPMNGVRQNIRPKKRTPLELSLDNWVKLFRFAEIGIFSSVVLINGESK